jgi:hypothetical protein
MVLDASQSTLFVARAGGTAIDVIDTATLTRTGSISTAPATPLTGSLAEAGGRLWFGNGTCSDTPGSAAFASVAESVGSPDVRTYPGTALARAACPHVFAAHGTPDSLFAWGMDDSSAPEDVLAEFDASGATPVITASLHFSDDGDWPIQLAENGAGTTIFDAGPIAAVRAYRVANLQPATPPYYVPGLDSAIGVAMLAKGKRLAAIAEGGSTHDAYIFYTDGSPGTLRYWIKGFVLPAGVGTSADDSRLFTVSLDGTTLRLTVVDDPLEQHANLSLTGPANPVHVGEAVNMHGDLGFTDEHEPKPGVAVHVTRTNPDGSSTTLPDVLAPDHGYFTASDTPPIAGTYGYTVSYDGNRTYLGTSASIDVVVGSGTPSLTVSASPDPVRRGGTVTVTIHLEQPSYDQTSNHSVSLTRKSFGHPPSTQTLPFDTTNTATAKFTLPTKTEFTARWSGDADWGEISSTTYGFVTTNVSGSLAGYYGTSGDGFRLYHYNSTCVRTHTTTCPHYHVTVDPAGDGGELEIEIQTYADGTWHDAGSSTFQLNPNGTITISLYYTGPGVKGVPTRVRAGFTSEAYSWSYSGWAKFKITG